MRDHKYHAYTFLMQGQPWNKFIQPEGMYYHQKHEVNEQKIASNNQSLQLSWDQSPKNK